MSEDKTPKIDRLIAKVKISGKIRLLTGMRIGGSKEAYDIGGLDLNAIKLPNGQPYVPGSSLKGKLRFLLAREEGSPEVEEDSLSIQQIFGEAGKDEERKVRGRLIVRDASIDAPEFESLFRDARLNEDFTEYKTENRIERVSGKAQHPRTLERVPEGASFDFNILFDELAPPEAENTDNWYGKENNRSLMELVIRAMRLLEDDYLGGQGSRGYGQIAFEGVKFQRKKIAAYRLPNSGWETIDEYQF